MSCFSRPDWPQYSQCVWEFLTEPVPLWLPWGVWMLLIFGSGFVLGALGFLIIKWLFGEEVVLKPFDLIGEWGREVWYFPYRWYRSRQFERWRREAEAEPAGETPAGAVREDPIDPAAVDTAPAGRRQEGD